MSYIPYNPIDVNGDGYTIVIPGEDYDPNIDIPVEEQQQSEDSSILYIILAIILGAFALTLG